MGKRRRATSPGDVLAHRTSPYPGAKAHKKIRSHHLVTVWKANGADYQPECLRLSRRLSKILLDSPLDHRRQEKETGSTRAAGFVVTQGDAGGWALLQEKWRERKGRFTSH